jgi:hypothetical protein
LQGAKQMKKIQILDIKSTKGNTSTLTQLPKKELDSTIGGGGDNCVKTSDGGCFCK